MGPSQYCNHPPTLIFGQHVREWTKLPDGKMSPFRSATGVRSFCAMALPWQNSMEENIICPWKMRFCLIPTAQNTKHSLRYVLFCFLNFATRFSRPYLCLLWVCLLFLLDSILFPYSLHQLGGVKATSSIPRYGNSVIYHESIFQVLGYQFPAPGKLYAAMGLRSIGTWKMILFTGA